MLTNLFNSPAMNYAGGFVPQAAPPMFGGYQPMQQNFFPQSYDGFQGSPEFCGGSSNGNAGVLMAIEALLMEFEQMQGGQAGFGQNGAMAAAGPNGASAVANAGPGAAAAASVGGDGAAAAAAAGGGAAAAAAGGGAAAAAAGGGAAAAAAGGGAAAAASTGNMCTKDNYQSNAAYQALSDVQKTEFQAKVESGGSCDPTDIGSFDPVALDLDGKGVSTSKNKIQFDMTGNGQKNTVNDIGQGTGVLCVDSSGDGKSGENGKGLLGDNTDLSRFGIQGKFSDGFSALQAIAQNAKQKGLINNDQTLDASELATLQQDYGLKIKQGSLNNQATSLADAGVSSIDLSQGAKGMMKNFDGQGNDQETQQGATFTRTNGTQGGYSDLWLKNQA